MLRRVVVIPFGVPESQKGLGLGLAALVHGFVRMSGTSVGLAQLHAQKAEGDEAGPPAPVEAFVPPQAWSDMCARSEVPDEVDVVLTGAFEPPDEGEGTLRILAFESRSGKTHTVLEASLDDDRAGAGVVDALERLGASFGGDVGPARDLADLPWEALESVLRAERCALFDPARGGPHDVLAAMTHLERAVAGAPGSAFPARRLAALALDVGVSESNGLPMGELALRTLDRAIADAPEQLELVEAKAALLLRLGRAEEAERKAMEAIETRTDRPRLYAVLSEARRRLGRLAEALGAARAGIAAAGPGPLLLTELGIVLAEQGANVEAQAAWGGALEADGRWAPAFSNLGTLAMRMSDAVLAQKLVDHALALREAAPPEMVRRAIEIAMAGEPEGIPRATRVATLARTLLELVPEDPWPHVVLARALASMGEKEAAMARLREVEAIAPHTPAAAEAVMGRLVLSDIDAAREIEACARAAHSAEGADLDEVAARARRLALVHGVWAASLAEAVAARRLGDLERAREAARRAREHGGRGSPAVLEESVRAHVALADGAGALELARALRDAEGPSPRALRCTALALRAAGQLDAARDVARRGLAATPEDADLASLVAELETPPKAPPPAEKKPVGVLSWLRDRFR
jgi:tetratricopeptide (TPR) repeat protein